MRHGAVVVAASVALLAAEASAQKQVDQLPETRSEVVRLDVVVSDGAGKLVRDLTSEDFQLLEDGKPQRLTNFLVVTRPKAPAATAAGSSEPPAAPGRSVVVFVDDLHIAPAHLDYTKEALHRLVSEFLATEDRVAIVTSSGTGGAPELTRDRASLGAAIDALALRQAPVAPARGSQLTPVQAELILRGDPNALQLATRLIRDEPGSVVSAQGPQAALEAAGGGTPASVVDPADRGAAHEVLRQARGILAEDLHFSEITLVRIDGVLRSLASLPGRKICLLVSDGFLVGAGTSDEQTRPLRSVVDAATRAGAVVYALDAAQGQTTLAADSSASGAPVPAGLRERVDRLSAQEFRETLSGLANDTGGFLVRNANELAAGLGRMLEDNDAYYLMAYEPTNTKRDGRFRRVEVRLPRRAGLVARTRKGYLAPDDRRDRVQRASAVKPGAPAARPLIDESEARAALGAAIPPNGVPVRLVVDYLDLPPSGSQAVIRAQVNLAGVAWRQSEGRQRLDLDLVGGVYDASGALVGSPFGKRFALALSPAEYQQALKAGLQYRNRVALSPGRFEVRMVAREPGAAAVGGAVQKLEVPDLKEGKLTLSSVFLSTSADAAAAGETEALRDVQTSRRFESGEKLYFQLYVYNLPAGQAGDVVLQAQIFSAGKPLAASTPQPVTVTVKDGVPLPQSSMMSLEGLAPGRYQLRIVVADRRANTRVHRDVDFTVQ